MGNQVDREVERSDSENGSQREAADQAQAGAERFLCVQAHQLPAPTPAFLRGPSEGRNRATGFDPRPSKRLSSLASDELGDLVEALVHASRDVVERGRPDVDGELAGLFEDPGRGRDRVFDIRIGRRGHRRDHLTVVGALHVEAGAGVAPLARHQEPLPLLHGFLPQLDGSLWTGPILVWLRSILQW